MRCIVVVLAAFVLAVAAGATDNESLGYSGETVVVGPGTDACATGVLMYDHDGTFENGYSWRYMGVAPPYYGAFGEGYDFGPGVVFCGAYWLSTLGGYYYGQSTDAYVWEGGVSATPGAVLGVVTGIVFDTIPIWPTVGQFDVDLNIAVSGEFTVGYWPNWPGGAVGYFCAADLNGFGGSPWTCIAPEIGYPTGWNDPSIVWGPTQSMGCGAYFGQATPVEADTWGAVKTLFR